MGGVRAKRSALLSRLGSSKEPARLLYRMSQARLPLHRPHTAPYPSPGPGQEGLKGQEPSALGLGTKPLAVHPPLTSGPSSDNQLSVSFWRPSPRAPRP